MNSYSQVLWEPGESKASEVCLFHFNTGCIRDAGGLRLDLIQLGNRAHMRMDAVAWLCCPDRSCGH